MRKRAKLLLQSAYVLATLAVVVALLASGREPHYQGQSLSAWLHAWAYEPSLSRKEEAKQATLQIGTNAVPYLLKYIRYKPPLWKKATTKALTKLKGLPFPGTIVPYAVTVDAAAVRAETAVYAFEALGQAAAYAYPDLAQLACDATQPEASERATRVLILRRMAATNALGIVLSNAPAEIRLKTLHYIAGLHDQSLLQALLPALLQRLHDEDVQVARWAVIIVTELKHSQPEATLGILVEALKSPKPEVRTELIRAIATFDTAAKPAVPYLVRFLTDGDPGVRKETTNVVRMLAPEALTNSPPK